MIQTAPSGRTRGGNRAAASLLVAACALACWGCGKSDLGSVSGTVTLDGAPLEGAEINFMPVGGGGVSFAETDSEGRYTLTYADGSKGAVIGQHTVSINKEKPEIPAGTGDKVDRPEDYGPSGLLPPKYNDKTELRAEVKAGDNKIDFPLTSK